MILNLTNSFKYYHLDPFCYLSAKVQRLQPKCSVCVDFQQSWLVSTDIFWSETMENKQDIKPHLERLSVAPQLALPLNASGPIGG